ncbi:VOC family protein [Phenylobacterium sp.]|uniref:VOC family protein n=1 Tax=Phenylobacterium sp. TaxID=1871053 RepID=UPI00263264F4|nr:VOC family protein [Phenylobacterium sp.]
MTRASVTPAIFYQDPKSAIAWLEKAFGFELAMLIETPDGQLSHSELRVGDGLIMVGTEWHEDTRSPKSIGGKNTQFLDIHIDDDIDGHCARARVAGAEIIQEPETQFYGDRTYRCRDPEGHLWTIGQTVKAVTREEAEQASGLKIQGWT